MRGEILPKRAKMSKWGWKSTPWTKVDQQGLKIVFCTKNTSISVGFFFLLEHMFSEEVRLNEVSLGGSPTISANLSWEDYMPLLYSPLTLLILHTFTCGPGFEVEHWKVKRRRLVNITCSKFYGRPPTAICDSSGDPWLDKKIVHN